MLLLRYMYIIGIVPCKVVIEKMWDGMGYRGLIPYHGIIWHLDLKSHTIAGIVP